AAAAPGGAAGGAARGRRGAAADRGLRAARSVNVADWRERAPALAAECAARWGVRLDGAPFATPGFSYGLPAGGGPLLQLTHRDPESDPEAAALAHWDGAGAVRLLAHDPEQRALLVERCVPGDQLWAVADEEAANAAAAVVLRRLWRPPPEGHAFRSLAGEAG